jgi:hypothetical protein
MLTKNSAKKEMLVMFNLASLLLLCGTLSAVAALPPKAEILADGLKAVNYWRANHDQYCGWEDATLMIGGEQSAAAVLLLLLFQTCWQASCMLHGA